MDVSTDDLRLIIGDQTIELKFKNKEISELRKAVEGLAEELDKLKPKSEEKQDPTP